MEAKFYKKPKKAVVINSNKQYDTYSKAFISLKFKNKEKNYKHLSNGTELSVLGFVVHEYELNTRCYKCVTKEGTEILIGNNGIKFTEEKEPKKGKLTIIVSKNYKELYEDNLALINHILLDTIKEDKEWIEKVQKSNLNITLYTDKNDPELFKKSFGKFEVKLMDVEELTLENIQVDCSDLKTEQIEEMKRVVVDNGYKLWNSSEAFKVNKIDKYFYYSDDEFGILGKEDYLTKITYDKFIELFDTKKEECNNNLKGLVLVSRKGVDKSRLQEPEYVEQMIKEGKILHAKNFNKSLVMDNGSTISNVKEGEAKSIEELHVKHKEQNSIGKSYSKEDLFLSVPVFNPQSHYNNEFGSLYKMSEQLGLNAYEFDILKRVVRCRKKGQFEEDLQKTKDLIDLYLIESKK